MEKEIKLKKEGICEYRYCDNVVIGNKGKRFCCRNCKSKNQRINKYENNPDFKERIQIRQLINFCIKNDKKSKKWSRFEEIVGLKTIYFRNYIESLFEPWMNWENYGKYNGGSGYGWCLEYVKQIEDVYELNHYTNFKPVCSYISRKMINNPDPGIL